MLIFCLLSLLPIVCCASAISGLCCCAPYSTPSIRTIFSIQLENREAIPNYLTSESALNLPLNPIVDRHTFLLPPLSFCRYFSAIFFLLFRQKYSTFPRESDGELFSLTVCGMACVNVCYGQIVYAVAKVCVLRTHRKKITMQIEYSSKAAAGSFELGELDGSCSLTVYPLGNPEWKFIWRKRRRKIKKNSTDRASNVTDHVHKYLSFLFLSSSSHSHKHSYRFDRIIICKMHISNFAPNRNRLALLLPHQR